MSPTRQPFGWQASLIAHPAETVDEWE